ncbi:pentalenene synthase [Streptomyces avermitilis]|uniref:pentalenene synthase n=1 Tax=Streptomyces avermitilis TaxID=33903 RepID=UPI0033AB8C46
MPQDVDFHIPFPSRRSPDFERARADHLSWPRALGLIGTDAAAERHSRGGYADLAARFYPSATGADLDLGVDLMSWFFLFDDLFDGPRGEDPQETRKLTDAVAAALDGPLPESAPPIAHGFADVWRRTCQGMSAAWRARSARHWRNYFSGYVDEAVSRHLNTPYDSAGHYLAMRRQTIGVQPTVDLAERACHCEVPQRVFDSAVLFAMLQIAIDTNLILNDIASLEKEEARGELNNMVFILMREHGWTRGRSIAHMQDGVRTRLEQFLLLEACLPKVYDTFELTAQERESAEKYRMDGVRSVIRGSYDWHRSSGRYDADYAIAASYQGYLEELGSTL